MKSDEPKIVGDDDEDIEDEEGQGKEVGEVEEPRPQAHKCMAGKKAAPKKPKRPALTHAPTNDEAEGCKYPAPKKATQRRLRSNSKAQVAEEDTLDEEVAAAGALRRNTLPCKAKKNQLTAGAAVKGYDEGVGDIEGEKME